ncbi:uncharacterized protein RJT20DRAFT_53980 [Scheffersomyces xylosifermentans]|uniref:uncharacterized protein n=1 Tax=Scheffersomyces xylosifermentans TaxID=1304137 RepID=UPI00315DDC95
MYSTNRSLVYLLVAIVVTTVLYTHTQTDLFLPSKYTSSTADAASVTSTTADNTSTATMSNLKSYIVTLKETVSDADYSGLQATIKQLGGEVTSQFSLIKGFVAKLPEIHTSAIEKHDQVLSVEEDKEVKIQS